MGSGWGCWVIAVLLFNGGLTTLVQGLQAHGLVGLGAIYYSLQDALDQGWLVAWKNPEVLSRQVAQAWAVLAGEFYQEGSTAMERKKEPL
jgi:hypothetical protein